MATEAKGAEIAAKFGVTYDHLRSDFSGINYSSVRAARIAFHGSAINKTATRTAPAKKETAAGLKDVKAGSDGNAG
jgi:hypothetical protein